MAPQASAQENSESPVAPEELNGTTPQMFGAVADGVHDDTQAIQDAVDALADNNEPDPLLRTRAVLYFPPGTYRITQPVVLSDESDRGNQHLVLAGSGAAGRRSSAVFVDFTDGPGFEIQSHLTAITRLCFVGVRNLGNQTNTIGVRYARTLNTDDMDGKVTDCLFNRFDTAVDYVGRGLLFQRNSVSLSTIGLAINWPSDGTVGGPPGQVVHLPPYGMRKWIITDNHFHALSRPIEVGSDDATNFRGALIANNLVDIGRAFFRGGISDSIISGNVVENANRAPIVVTAGGRNLTISDNVLGGYEIDRENDPEQSTYRPISAVVFQSGANPEFVSITGNTLKWTRRSSIRFEGPVRDVTISGNTFYAWSALWDVPPSADDGGIRVEADVTRMSLVGNVFARNPASDGAAVRVHGTLTDSNIVGNSWDTQQDLVSADQVEDCYVERSPGRFNRMEMESPSGGHARVAWTSSTAPGTGNAYGGYVVETSEDIAAGPGVKGGIRVTARNQRGSAATEVLCSSLEDNELISMLFGAAGMMPPADGGRDIGSADRRINTLHARTVMLHSRAIEDLPPASDHPGSLVTVDEGRGGSKRLVISDGEAWRQIPIGPPVA